MGVVQIGNHYIFQGIYPPPGALDFIGKQVAGLLRFRQFYQILAKDPPMPCDGPVRAGRRFEQSRRKASFRPLRLRMAGTSTERMFFSPISKLTLRAG